MTIARTGPSEQRRELADRAQTLAAEGYLQREIAVILGVSRSYASALASNDPLGEKTRARKDSYRGVCDDCGNPTDGSYGPNNTPAVCDACSHARQRADKRWTREAVVDAIRRFHAQHGRPPRAQEWIASDQGNGYPTRTAVYRSQSNSTAPFAKWADAIEAAGFPRPMTGHYERPPKGNRRQRKVEGRAVNMRDFVVLEQQDDGSWITHEGINAYSEQLAIEKYIDGAGASNGLASHRFVAIPSHRWVVRELQPVTTFKAVAVEAVKA